jgi:hypothetical protein
MQIVARTDPRARVLPIIYTPTPVIGVSSEALFEKLLEGNDPETNKPVIEEIIEVLTKPQEIKAREPAAANEPTICEKFLSGNEDYLEQLFYDRNWTDGLPVILPTRERVQRMLTGTSHAPEEQVGQYYDHDHHELIKYTVQDIAVISVMAGAKPEYLPVILAIASMKQSAIAPSTTAFGNLLLVNGPIRNEIKMNSGIGAFSPLNQANATIGRAWTLMSISWGCARIKRTVWSSQGCTDVYNNMCAAENEERSVWTPFHVDKGFKAQESVVSFFRGWAMVNSIGCAANRPLSEELSRQFTAIPPINSRATIIIDPLIAANLKDNEGYETKRDYCKHLAENIKIKAGDYWKTDHISMLMSAQAVKGIEPYATGRLCPRKLI